MFFSRFVPVFVATISFLTAQAGFGDTTSATLKHFAPEKSQALSFGSAETEQIVHFRIRLIRGDYLESSRIMSVRSTAKSRREIRLAPEVKDIGSSLRELPYSSFRLIQSSTQAVPLLRKETLTLDDGSILTVRPLSIEKTERGHRAALWLRWNDRTGESILDTKVHLKCGTPIIAGTDGAGRAGTILAVELAVR